MDETLSPRPEQVTPQELAAAYAAEVIGTMPEITQRHIAPGAEFRTAVTWTLRQITLDGGEQSEERKRLQQLVADMREADPDSPAGFVYDALHDGPIVVGRGDELITLVNAKFGGAINGQRSLIRGYDAVIPLTGPGRGKRLSRREYDLDSPWWANEEAA